MKNECLWGVDIEFKILMRKVKSPLKQTTPLQICSAPFLNSPETELTIAVSDPGEGPGGPALPLCLDQAEARRAEKNLF